LRRKKEKFEQLAEKKSIPICNFPSGNKKSFIIKGICNGIAINKNLIRSEAEEALCIGHELGHEEEGAYYVQGFTPEQIANAERKADIWLIKNVCPIEDLRSAFLCGCKECWEVAEELSIPDYIVKDAIKHYRSKGLI